MNSCTADGTLYHGRVLDYGVDLRLQDHAVLIVAEPEGGIPFVNVGYAGFIGSVTGMNARHVSIGEMGGGGLGHWDGVPLTADNLADYRLRPAAAATEAGSGHLAQGTATAATATAAPIATPESEPRLGTIEWGLGIFALVVVTATIGGVLLWRNRSR